MNNAMAWRTRQSALVSKYWDDPKLRLLAAAAKSIVQTPRNPIRNAGFFWAEEKISVRRFKQRKVQAYPLTTEVGNALLRYLKEARPQCAHREVLLTLRRPYRPVSVGALSTMTQKLQKRLGLQLKRYGPHAMHHACATHLLAQGLTLKEVGDHLGHVSAAAT